MEPRTRTTRRTIAVCAALGALGLSAGAAGSRADVVPLPAAVAPLLPEASACQVTVLDGDSVKVTGSVDPNALATTYRVEYGLDGLLNLSSPTTAAGASPDPTAVGVQLDDLVPNGSYSCRIVALNSVGQTAGSTTLFVAPGGSAVNLANGQMVLAGSSGSVACTLTGTKGNDRLKGTNGRDVICGLGGADRITGLGGADVLVGGAGSDRVYGGAGNDRVYGGSGNDRVYGGARSDRVHGGAGSDRILGSGGKDRLWGGAGRDVLSGGRGRDYLRGMKGRDRMSGGGGNDRLVAGDDRRRGDSVHGGRGRDWASVNRGDRKRSVERVVRRSRR